jgi:multiple sugar transport system permease protein
LTDWTTIAAGSALFLLPVALFTFFLRNNLLRGVTFGAIRK